MWCQVTVRGNWFPRLEWSIKGGRSLTAETVYNGTIIVSVVKISVESIVTKDRYVQFVCETFFSPENQSFAVYGSQAASNVPEYRHTWTSPELILNPEQTTGLFSCWTISNGIYNSKDDDDDDYDDDNNYNNYDDNDIIINIFIAVQGLRHRIYWVHENRNTSTIYERRIQNELFEWCGCWGPLRCRHILWNN